ncbi:MAG: hypothetical protein U0R66_06680 [Mycobacterium sp.]
MRAVAILTITGLVALVVALMTGSTPLAVLVIGLAVAGIALLLRDWRDDRNLASAEPSPEGEPGQRLSPDEFSPDISTDPNGPSSNARAD